MYPPLPRQGKLTLRLRAHSCASFTTVASTFLGFSILRRLFTSDFHARSQRATDKLFLALGHEVLILNSGQRRPFLPASQSSEVWHASSYRNG